MSDRINLLRRVSELNKSPQFDSYSKVIIHVDDETNITVGNDYGRTLEFTNPFGTQQMANDLLAKLRGFQYQPYTASGALLDPAAEIGDGIAIKNVYGGLYTRARTFNRLMKADISAPHDEEINHEYQFETPQERKVKRQFGDVRATLSVQADQIAAEVTQRQADSAEFRGQFQVQATQIAAKVSQTGGNNASFGWSLKATEFGLYSGNKKVFYVNSGGAHVQGEITATSGKIGNFNIGSTAIWNNISQYGGTQTTGVYLGTDGIQLGQRFKVDTLGNVTASNLAITGGSIKLGGNAQNPVFQVTSSGAVTASNLTLNGGSINLGNGTFRVTSTGAVTASNLSINGGAIRIGSNFSVNSSGNVTANNITLTGTLSVGGGNIYANDLRVGAQESYNGYNGWNGTTNTVNSNGGNWTSAYDWKQGNGDYCIGGAGYGYNFDAMKYGGGNAFPINASSFRYGGTQLRPQTISILDGNGNVRTFHGVLMEISE